MEEFLKFDLEYDQPGIQHSNYFFLSRTLNYYIINLLLSLQLLVSYKYFKNYLYADAQISIARLTVAMVMQSINELY